MSFRDLPTMAEIHATRRATPKGTPKTAEKAPPKKKRPELDPRERACTAAVWKRDQHRSRASALPVTKGADIETERGEVAHLAARSTSPEKRWDPDNCVLLTAEEHRLSDPRTAPHGKILLAIAGKHANKELRFIRLAPDGSVLWTRRSLPPPRPRPT
jgi:hypothetical protein